MMHRTRLLTGFLLVIYGFLSACMQAPGVSQSPLPTSTANLTQSPEPDRIQLDQDQLLAMEQAAVSDNISTKIDPVNELSGSLVLCIPGKRARSKA